MSAIIQNWLARFALNWNIEIESNVLLGISLSFLTSMMANLSPWLGSSRM